MTVLIADDTFRDAPAGPVQIRTADGKSLGFFTVSKVVPTDLDPGISEEELRRRFTDMNCRWYTAAQVEAKMKEWACSQ